MFWSRVSADVILRNTLFSFSGLQYVRCETVTLFASGAWPIAFMACKICFQDSCNRSCWLDISGNPSGKNN